MTAVQAMRLGFAAFILPFMFYFTPAILMQGSGLEIASVFGSALVAVVLINIALQGQLYGSLGWGWRVVCMAAALMMFSGSVLITSVGLVIAAAVVLLRFRDGRLKTLALQ